MKYEYAISILNKQIDFDRHYPDYQDLIKQLESAIKLLQESEWKEFRKEVVEKAEFKESEEKWN